MPLARRLARFNRRVANPVIRTFAGWVPPLAVVEHRGRRSGRRYRTPVVAMRRGGGWRIALAYGSDSEWARNVLAAGGCTLERAGRRILLHEPRIVPGRLSFLHLSADRR